MIGAFYDLQSVSRFSSSLFCPTQQHKIFIFFLWVLKNFKAVGLVWIGFGE